MCVSRLRSFHVGALSSSPHVVPAAARETWRSAGWRRRRRWRQSTSGGRWDRVRRWKDVGCQQWSNVPRRRNQREHHSGYRGSSVYVSVAAEFEAPCHVRWYSAQKAQQNLERRNDLLAFGSVIDRFPEISVNLLQSTVSHERLEAQRV